MCLLFATIRLDSYFGICVVLWKHNSTFSVNTTSALYIYVIARYTCYPLLIREILERQIDLPLYLILIASFLVLLVRYTLLYRLQSTHRKLHQFLPPSPLDLPSAILLLLPTIPFLSEPIRHYRIILG
jgi:hypothetical protein